ncbi:unnamed protein product [Vitrella brassicaformis CCMP3155]|uniref:Uncharacterized protein n=1 Tax=Vitrella brassicaformis (strain CCMP3155) TaxID=1169540 RepID=A0A0G4FGG6_VITBC|nr:unnamed protein product [Vitrella brassicaformis CCMP3155]|eukprot:CEM12166.1 unnamed protein product [Vitrella brassicaformis CCMP3155]
MTGVCVTRSALPLAPPSTHGCPHLPHPPAPAAAPSQTDHPAVADSLPHTTVLDLPLRTPDSIVAAVLDWGESTDEDDAEADDGAHSRAGAEDHHWIDPAVGAGAEELHLSLCCKERALVLPAEGEGDDCVGFFQRSTDMPAADTEMTHSILAVHPIFCADMDTHGGARGGGRGGKGRTSSSGKAPSISTSTPTHTATATAVRQHHQQQQHWPVSILKRKATPTVSKQPEGTQASSESDTDHRLKQPVLSRHDSIVLRKGQLQADMDGKQHQKNCGSDCCGKVVDGEALAMPDGWTSFAPTASSSTTVDSPTPVPVSFPAPNDTDTDAHAAPAACDSTSLPSDEPSSADDHLLLCPTATANHTDGRLGGAGFGSVEACVKSGTDVSGMSSGSVLTEGGEGEVEGGGEEPVDSLGRLVEFCEDGRRIRRDAWGTPIGAEGGRHKVTFRDAILNAPLCDVHVSWTHYPSPSCKTQPPCFPPFRLAHLSPTRLFPPQSPMARRLQQHQHQQLKQRPPHPHALPAPPTTLDPNRMAVDPARVDYLDVAVQEDHRITGNGRVVAVRLSRGARDDADGHHGAIGRSVSAPALGGRLPLRVCDQSPVSLHGVSVAYEVREGCVDGVGGLLGEEVGVSGDGYGDGWDDVRRRRGKHKACAIM